MLDPPGVYRLFINPDWFSIIIFLFEQFNGYGPVTYCFYFNKPVCGRRKVCCSGGRKYKLQMLGIFNDRRSEEISIGLSAVSIKAKIKGIISRVKPFAVISASVPSNLCDPFADLLPDNPVDTVLVIYCY